MSTLPKSHSIKALILAGGKSTRLGRPKHLLQTPSGERLYERQTRLLQSVVPDAAIHVSLARESELDEILSKLPVTCGSHEENATPRSVLFDEHPNTGRESSGPASGLLAAHALDPAATWLVLACDYPLLPAKAVQRLLEEPGEPPVVCYRSADGFCEPLLGIWRPSALRVLAERVGEGRLSASSAVRASGGRVLEAPAGCEWWFSNVNTAEDWDRIRDRCSPSPA